MARTLPDPGWISTSVSAFPPGLYVPLLAGRTQLTAFVAAVWSSELMVV